MAIALALVVAMIVGAAAASAILPTPTPPISRDASRPAPLTAGTIGPEAVDTSTSAARWAVRTYQSKLNWACVQLGHTDGKTFGRLDGESGTVSPVALPELGSCADVTADGYFVWVDHYADSHSAAVFGVVEPGASVSLTDGVSTQTLDVVEGAFLTIIPEEDLRGSVVSVSMSNGTAKNTTLAALANRGDG